VKTSGGLRQQVAGLLDRAAASIANAPEGKLRRSLTGAGFTELARHEPRFAGEAIRRLGRALDLRRGESARNRCLDLISPAEAHLWRIATSSSPCRRPVARSSRPREPRHCGSGGGWAICSSGCART
jgi:hypothetical protein